MRSLRDFYIGKAGKPGLVFGLGLIAERDIDEALEILSRLRKR